MENIFMLTWSHLHVAMNRELLGGENQAFNEDKAGCEELHEDVKKLYWTQN